MDDTLSIERAAVLLGMTRAEVILLILARSLPPYLEGRSLRIRVADVLHWLEQQLDERLLEDLMGEEMPW
jgi:excisionase family DNA binding protein